MPYFNHTVLFIGTRQGQLLKVHVYFFSLLIISPSPSSRFPLCLATTLFAETKYVALYALIKSSFSLLDQATEDLFCGPY